MYCISCSMLMAYRGGASWFNVGEDKRQRALLLGLRTNMTILPLKNAEPLIDKSEAWVFDHQGLVLQQAEVEEVQAILRPDNSLVRLYDLTLVAVKGLDSRDYQVAPLATSMPFARNVVYCCLSSSCARRLGARIQEG